MNRHRLLVLLGATAAAVAQAETSPYYVGASQTFTHESNLLRLADGDTAPAGSSKSDTISSTALLAGIDQPIGRQRLFGNLTLRANRLSNNEIYDNESYALAAGIDWATVDNISGGLKFSANRNLASFNTVEIGLVTKKNLESTQQVEASVRVGVVTEWTAEIGASHRSVDYSAAEYRSREFRQDSLSAGLRYRPAATGTFGVALRSAKGKYPRFFNLAPDVYEADAFERRDLDLTATLLPSCASTFNARVSWSQTRYDVATERDFSGVTGMLKWSWAATGKLRVETRLARDPSQDSYFSDLAAGQTVDYSRVTTSLRLRADYDLSAKIAVNTTLSTAQRSLTRTLQNSFGASLADNGSDRTSGLALGATWTPTRSVQVGCDIASDKRRGDAPLSSNLSSTTTSCFGQFTLQ